MLPVQTILILKLYVAASVQATERCNIIDITYIGMFNIYCLYYTYNQTNCESFKYCLNIELRFASEIALK